LIVPDLYYSAKRDDELFAVSSIQIDNDMATLKDLKKELLYFNLWSDSSIVRFYMNNRNDTPENNKQLPYTTSLEECLIGNKYTNPLCIDVRTELNPGMFVKK
jgi:regulatory protein YycH of two-component signal transduction system YycFG